MIYILALIGLVAVVVLFWKAFGPSAGAAPTRTVGPDDDPDFLWRINREARRGGKDGTEAGTEPTE
ncbi:hypothetical protein QM797_23510 [Rhodococcus sp. IEGM 1381]|uniref:hypothetical protein n=1 Tax=Rhodococcus sp. IEGM 1381 TaxID=3047085 RepID=UPI0024B6B88F|nr:hypothetical protein [Rhodococcus sp. IEGM 1381]MDI9897698.1 hypothetical protein [Rhodococcus sp. IEGM 1381]